MSRKKRLAVFASGTGSNFEAIVTACEQGKIPAETVALVCDKPSARVVERASRHGVKSFTFDPKSFASKVEMETVIADFLDENGVDLVCLAGYMRIISDTLLSRYDGKIINIHPSLLPAFPGARAVEQAMEYGGESVRSNYSLCGPYGRWRTDYRPTGYPVRRKRYR